MRALPIIAASVATVFAGVACFITVAPDHAAELALDAERWHAGLTRREIDLRDGLHFAYLEGGSGAPLLLLHGFGAEKDHFTRVARFLTPHYRVVVPDHVGFGESSRPRDVSYDPPAQVERLRALMQALEIERVHIGGNSMGGAIAAMYAAMHPDEVGSLWLLAPSGVWSAPKSELFITFETTGHNELIPADEDAFVRLFAFATADPPYVPRFVADAMARRRLRDNALEPRIFEEVNAFSIEESVTGLTTPTLIVWGAQDRALHVDSAEILHARLPRSRVIIMPGVGHVPMIERPRETAEDYLRFRRSLPARATSAAVAGSSVAAEVGVVDALADQIADGRAQLLGRGPADEVPAVEDSLDREIR